MSQALEHPECDTEPDDTSHPCPCSDLAEEVRTRSVVVVELIERGTSVAGLAVSGGRPPRLWTAGLA